MSKFIHYKGFRFSLKDTVRAPEKRFGLPCYYKASCRVKYCKERDSIDYFDCEKTFCEEPTCNYCLDVKCHKDCERRINLEEVSVRVCIKSECEYFKPEGCYCQKYLEETKVRHKPTPFQFSTRLRKPSGVDGGFWYRDLK